MMPTIADPGGHDRCSLAGSMRALLTFALLSFVACGGDTTSVSASSDSGTVSDGTGGGDGGGATDAVTPTLPACTDCLATTVTWEENGGHVAFVDTSSLSTCRTYARARTSSGKQTLQCTSELGACSVAPIAVGDVEAALAHADVVGALSSDTKTYGADSRPCDGSVLAITIGAKTLEVGGECKGEPTGCSPNPCVPVPAGVRALATLLQKLDAQEIAKPACSAFR